MRLNKINDIPPQNRQEVQENRKGRLALERNESKPERKAYLKSYHEDTENKAKANRRR